MRLLLLFITVASAAQASECPPAPDHAAEEAALIAQIQVAPDPASAQTVSDALWALWTDAPDEAAQAILDRGMKKRAAWDLLGARSDFDTLVSYCPSYAEGYNQRAFVNFLSQDYEAALQDLDRAIALSPQHVGALSGRALTLIGMGRDAEAQDALAAALELNPWLPERELYRPPPKKEIPGKEL